ncbi:hypothetical protein Hdeb2414_s0005g00158921 [Helianthus debilis subsp. tardiflorus]
MWFWMVRDERLHGMGMILQGRMIRHVIATSPSLRGWSIPQFQWSGNERMVLDDLTPPLCFFLIFHYF